MSFSNKYFKFYLTLILIGFIYPISAQDVCSPVQKSPVDNSTDEKVKISWSLSTEICKTDGDYFEVVYGTTESCTDGSKITFGLYLNFYYNSLKRGKRNYFKIRAFSYTYGNSIWSNIKYFDVPSAPIDPPEKPTSVKIVPNTYQNDGENLILSWSICARTNKYEVEEYWEEEYASSYQPQTTSILTSSHAYYAYEKFRVRAIGDGGSSDWSVWVRANRQSDPATGGINIVIANSSNSTISPEYRISNGSWQSVGSISSNLTTSIMLGNINVGSYSVDIRWLDPSLHITKQKGPITKEVLPGQSTDFNFTIEDQQYHFSFNPNNWKINKGNNLIVSGKLLDNNNNPVNGVAISVEDPIQMMSLPNVAVSNTSGEFSYTIKTFPNTPIKNYTFTFFAGWSGDCYNLLTVAVADPSSLFSFVMPNYFISVGEIGAYGLTNDANLLNASVTSTYIINPTPTDQANAAKKFMQAVGEYGLDYIHMNLNDPAFKVGIIGTASCVVPTGFTQVTSCPIGVTILSETILKNTIIQGMRIIVDVLPIASQEKDKLRLAIDVGNFAISVVSFKADFSMIKTVASISSVSSAAYDVLTDVSDSYDRIVLAGSNGQETQAFLMTRLNETYVSNEKETSETDLNQNYPNPVTQSTTISFNISSKSFVLLKVYDSLGKEVASILSEVLSPGNYTREWNIENIKNGIYFYRLEFDNYSITKKLIINH